MSNKKLAKNIGSMSSAVFLSRISGLARDIFMTGFFGTTYVADAFNAAYQIPNLLRKLFGEGALSAAFIPIYNEIKLKEGKSGQIKFALNVLSLLSLFLLVLCLLGIFLAPLIVRLLAPGFDAQTYTLAVKLTKILFPYLFLIGLSSTLISIANSHDYFFIPGLSSAFLNLAMIGTPAIFILLHQNTSSVSQITFLSFGVILGGVLQTVVNLPLLKRIGYKLKVDLNIKGEAIHSVWKRFLPGVAGLAIREVNLAADLIIASFLATGGLAALSYGNRLMQLPLGVFGVSAGVAVLPLFSRLSSEAKWDDLAKRLRFTFITLSLIMLPVTAFIIGTGRDVIRILFMRGKFDLTSLNQTYEALVFYSIGLLFFALNRILIPIFYANKDTKTPVKISAVIVVINITLNLILMKFMGLAGLAFATSISAFIHFVILIKTMNRKLPKIQLPEIQNSVVKILFISLVIFVAAYFINRFVPAESTLQTVIRLLIHSTAGLLIFVSGALLLKIENSRKILKKLWKR